MDAHRRAKPVGLGRVPRRATTAGQLLVAPGEPWVVLARTPADPEALRTVAVDPSLPADRGSVALYPFPSPYRPGVIQGASGPRRLVRWDAARGVFGVTEPLPPMVYERSERVAFRDGVVEVAWTGGSQSVHSPTDPHGTRRYFQEWHFDHGEVSLLRLDHGVWIADDVTPLPLRDAHGTMSEGYVPLVLRNGLYASVLLLPLHVPEPAWLIAYRRPCEHQRPPR